MSNNIPFDIQLAIMNRLLVKYLLQFHSVSKLWKYSIDCSDFVREYGFRESNNCVWCFSYGENSMLLIWNPSLKKSVRILVPNYLLEADSPKMLFGFAVHPVTLCVPQLSQMDSNFNNENEPWEFSLDIDDSDLQLTPVLRSSTSNPVRIILGPAGLVLQAKLVKDNVFILDPNGALMSTQEYMQKIIEDVGEDADFNSGAWISATNYVNALVAL
ncbi:probable transmembrane ascorbate ferrireductase 4 [Tanacetum coccineum]